jgi:hypothetical protein
LEATPSIVNESTRQSEQRRLSPDPCDPEVSIIIPAYNYGAILPQTLEAVLAQSTPAWECIIVDDASTDNTREVLGAWSEQDRRFRAVVQDANRGPSAARNRGLLEARGRFIQFLDADDRLQRRKLELHACFLGEHPDVDIVYGDVRFFRTETPERLMASLHGKLSRPFITPLSGRGARLVDVLIEHNLMPINAALIRRETFDRVGVFEEAMRGCEDWDFFMRCAILDCCFVHHAPPEALALVRSHSSSASRDQLRLLSGLAAGAERFPATAAGRTWKRTTLPPVYEAALGVRNARQGRRLEGARQLRAAVRTATQPGLKLRWSVYALAALMAPPSIFRWLVSRPMPELPIEVWRTIASGTWPWHRRRA